MRLARLGVRSSNAMRAVLERPLQSVAEKSVGAVREPPVLFSRSRDFFAIVILDSYNIIQYNIQYNLEQYLSDIKRY